LKIKDKDFKETYTFQIFSCHFNVAAKIYRKKNQLKEEEIMKTKPRRKKQLYKFDLEIRCLFLAARIIRH